MKTNFYLVCLLMCSFLVSNAQITYTYDDYATDGEEFIYSVDTVLEAIDFINLQGDDWDLSGLNEDLKDTIFFNLPSEYGEIADQFPSANLVLERSDNSLVFLDKALNGVNLLNADFTDLGFNLPDSDIPEGIFEYTSLSTPLKILDFPMNYESSFSGELNETFSLENTFEFLDTVSFEIAGGFTITGEDIDSIRIIISMNSTHTVDDFGNITLPVGSFETIRKKTERTFNITLGMGIQIPYLGFQWVDVPQGIIPNTEYTVTVFNWYAKGVGVPVVKARIKQELNIDETQNKVDLEFSSISYLKVSPNSLENISFSNEAKVYPNPASDMIYIETEKTNKIEIYNVLGMKVNSFEQISPKMNLPISEFENGVYFYKVYTKNNKHLKTGKFIIQK